LVPLPPSSEAGRISMAISGGEDVATGEEVEEEVVVMDTS
jgi:hypothetical protein